MTEELRLPMQLKLSGRGYPLELVGDDSGFKAYLNDTLIATIGSGGDFSVVSIPGLSGTAGVISDTAFTSAWDGVTDVSPSKNSVYDQMVLKANLISPALVTPNIGAASGTSLDLYDATSLGSESLNQTNFATATQWGVTGDFDAGFTGGKAVYVTASTSAGTLTQTSGNLAVALKANRWYKFVYTTAALTGAPTAVIPTSVALTQQSLSVANGVAKSIIFKSAASVGNFVINVASTGAGQGFNLDDVSLKEITGGGILTSGPILLGDGSASAPSLAFVSDPDTGLWSGGVNVLSLGANGVERLAIGPTDVAVSSNINLILYGGAAKFLYGSYLSFGSAGSQTTFLYEDAVNTLALKNANAAQQFNIYSGNGAYGLIKSKQELVTTTAAATVTTSGTTFIPAGAVPLAISTFLTNAMSASTLSGYSVGDGSDVDRWGIATLAESASNSGAYTDNAKWTATTVQAFTTAQAITITSSGANFPAGGIIRVAMTYISGQAPTS